MAAYSYAETYVLTAVTVDTGIYSVTSPKIPRSLIGKKLTVASFVEGDNNGEFTVTDVGPNTITTDNSSSVEETHAGTATVKTLSVTSTVGIGDSDTVELREKLAAIDILQPTVALSAGILRVTLASGPILDCYLSTDKIIINTGTPDSTAYDLTAAGNANGVYTGTAEVTANSLRGCRVIISGFTATENNGNFTVTANNGSTTITTTNTASSTESHAGVATIIASNDRWSVADLKNVLDFVEVARRTISSYTATVFTVAYPA